MPKYFCIALNYLFPNSYIHIHSKITNISWHPVWKLSFICSYTYTIVFIVWRQNWTHFCGHYTIECFRKKCRPLFSWFHVHLHVCLSHTFYIWNIKLAPFSHCFYFLAYKNVYFPSLMVVNLGWVSKKNEIKCLNLFILTALLT